MGRITRPCQDELIPIIEMLCVVSVKGVAQYVVPLVQSVLTYWSFHKSWVNLQTIRVTKRGILTTHENQ
jgi:hypothetical protein